MQFARAYPRVYGGAGLWENQRFQGVGLSPRVRGSLLRAFGSQVVDGPIPACTGEPAKVVDAWMLPPAYPRVYGGA